MSGNVETMINTEKSPHLIALLFSSHTILDALKASSASLSNLEIVFTRSHREVVGVFQKLTAQTHRGRNAT